MSMSEVLVKVYKYQQNHEAPSNERSPLGMQSRQRKRRNRSFSRSDEKDSDSSPERSRRRRDYDSNTMSIAASDEDIKQLLNGSEPCAQDQMTAAEAGEDGLMKKLGEAFQDEEEKGAKINQEVADIVDTRWGKKLA